MTDNFIAPSNTQPNFDSAAQPPKAPQSPPTKKSARKRALVIVLVIALLAGGIFGGKLILEQTKPHRQPAAKNQAAKSYGANGYIAAPSGSAGSWVKLSQNWVTNLDRNALVNYYLASDGTRAFLGVSSFGKDTASGLRAYDGATGKLLWSAPIAGGIKGYPVVGNGLVVQADSQGNYIAFDTASGKERWRAHAKHLFLDRQETPGVFLDSVFYYAEPFTNPDKDAVVGVDAATGAEKYRLALNNNLGVQSPRVSGNFIVIGTDRGTVAALSKDLKLQWQQQFKDGEQVPSKTYAFGDVVIGTNTINTDQSKIWAWDAATGKQLWTKIVAKDVFEPSTPPVFVNNVLAVRGSAPNLRVVGFDPKTGNQLWDGGTMPRSSSGRQGFGVADGTLFATSHDIEIIDSATGKSIFHKTMPYGTSVAPVAAGDHIIAVYADGLYGFN